MKEECNHQWIPDTFEEETEPDPEDGTNPFVPTGEYKLTHVRCSTCLQRKQIDS